MFVAGFIGSPKMNMIAGQVSGDGSGTAVDICQGAYHITAPQFDGLASSGASVTLGIRPEHITLEDGPGALPLQVTLIEYLGEESIVYGVLKDGTKVTVKTPYRAHCADQDTTMITFRSNRLHLFDEMGEAIRPGLTEN